MNANESPFGEQTGERRRVLRWSLHLGIPLAAMVVVYFVTRGAKQPIASAAHDHAVSPVAESGRPVMLSSDEAKRIGVTYAVASMGQLEREIRTVGQVTFDETRVKAISPKVDGWVERLYVDFTGQAVQADAPLLAIYSPMLVTAQEELLLAKRLQAEVVRGSEDARTSAAD